MSQTQPRMFRARDMLRDGPTFFRFAAVMGLQMGQVLPAAFVGLMLPVILPGTGPLAGHVVGVHHSDDPYLVAAALGTVR